MKRILFYSSVRDLSSFVSQRFYVIDILLLKELGYDVIITNKIIDFIRFYRYDLSFLYFYRKSLFSAILSRLFCKKVYMTGGIDALDRNLVSEKEYIFQKIMFKLCYLFANKCVVVSNSDLKNISGLYKKKPTKLFFSYHVINIEKFSCGFEKKCEELFVTIGWMETKANVIRKGIDRALYVFEKLVANKKYADSKFVIIGKLGEGSDYLREIVENLRLEEYVSFVGSISEEDKVSLLKKSKYYFQLSSYEGFGISALEALAASNIVIHSGMGGLNDTIKSFGIKIDIQKNYENMTASILDLIEQFDYNKLIDGYNYIHETFSLEKRREEFRELLK